MARYIDLDKAEFLKVEDNKEFNHGVDYCINKLLEIEPANVIERSKIDKAIEEMESIELVMFCEEMRDYCVEILKRNIEEEILK